MTFQARLLHNQEDVNSDRYDLVVEQSSLESQSRGYAKTPILTVPAPHVEYFAFAFEIKRAATILSAEPPLHYAVVGSGPRGETCGCWDAQIYFASFSDLKLAWEYFLLSRSICVLLGTFVLVHTPTTFF